MKTEFESDQEGIAIIGMALRFPGAPLVEQFWKNLCEGVESIRAFSDEELLSGGEDPALLTSPAYVKSSGVLEGVEFFDADFFGFTPREAESTDPQHRLFLECSWEALENAGYDPDRYAGRIGVFAGAGLHCYYQHHLAANPRVLKLLGDLQRFISIEKDFVSTRVSYRLNLKGPSISVQTACSTSLVAVHLACQSLLNGESDMVLAGGVSIRLPQNSGYLYQEGSILSPDGHCRAFDAAAQGTVFGSGSGIVVLKRLADAIHDKDYIHAVIRGSAINNDGALKVGFTAPSIDGQANVVADAQAVAGVTADQVTYVETHGTGTSMGDPIEVAALTKAFRNTTQGKSFCAIGSLKTNVGHLDAAAGVAGLIKTVLALEHRTLPPSLNFSAPNPAIDFANSPFYVQTRLADWQPPTGRRIAGVSSFGIGGTNAHVVVEEAPAKEECKDSAEWQLLTLSARTPAALDRATLRLAEYVAQNRDLRLADIAFTLQNGRRAFSHRRVLAAKNMEDAISVLQAHNSRRVFTGTTPEGDANVVFMFPAQGAQHANMGGDLYQREPVFREYVDLCATLLHDTLGIDLRKLLFPDDSDADDAAEQLKQTKFTQPAVFAVNYALAQLWISWGINPVAMVGHSLGEYVAATVAGVFELKDALFLVAERARLMQELLPGSMLSVHLSEEGIKPWLGESISLAGVNAPNLVAVSGDLGSIERLKAEFTKQGIDFQELRTSHAFHSGMMEPMIAPFEERVAKSRPRAPRIPFVSTLTGQWITDSEATDPGYWGRQTRYGVRFGPAVVELIKTPRRVLLEVGPGNTLTTLATQQLGPGMQCVAVNSLRHPKETRSDHDCVLTALGRLWLGGAQIDWSSVRGSEPGTRTPLPTYPFERKRYWLDAAKSAAQAVSAAETHEAVYAGSGDGEHTHLCPTEPIPEPVGMVPSGRPNLGVENIAPHSKTEETLARIWKEVLGVDQIDVDDNFFELGGQSLMGVALINEVGRIFQRRFPVQRLLDAPSIRQFACFIDRESSAQDERELTMNLETVGRQVRQFISESFLGGDGNGLSDQDSLLEQNVVDESNLLHLVSFLEETYGFAMKDEDVTADNLGSVSKIAAYVLDRSNQEKVALTHL